jgi:hypothetical protein
MTNLEIAKTIQHQIKSLSPFALMSYGAQDFVALPEDKSRSGGLMFKVNGHIHKGIVRINLTWMDEYHIEFVNQKDEVVKDVDGIYFDQLIQVLDDEIEGVKYAR